MSWRSLKVTDRGCWLLCSGKGHWNGQRLATNSEVWFQSWHSLSNHAFQLSTTACVCKYSIHGLTFWYDVWKHWLRILPMISFLSICETNTQKNSIIEWRNLYPFNALSWNSTIWFFFHQTMGAEICFYHHHLTCHSIDQVVQVRLASSDFAWYWKIDQYPHVCDQPWGNQHTLHWKLCEKQALIKTLTGPCFYSHCT